MGVKDLHRTSQVAQRVENLPAMWETWVRPLGWKDPLDERMATCSSILAWRIPMDSGAWQATVHVITKSHTRLNDWAAATKIHTQNLALKFISDNNVKISILLRVWYQLIILSNANWISFYFLYMVHEFQHKHDEWFGSVIWLPQALCHSQIHLYNSNQWIRTIKVKPMTAKSYW